MPSEFKHVRRVEFADTDLAGIVHFARFFVFMEAAEHAFHRSLGLSIHGVEDGATYGWPRVRAACEYLAPLRFEDKVEIHLQVREKRTRSVTYDFVFRRIDDGQPGAVVARGAITAVFIRGDPATGGMAAAPIPPRIAEQLEEAPRAMAGGASA